MLDSNKALSAPPRCPAKGLLAPAAHFLPPLGALPLVLPPPVQGML